MGGAVAKRFAAYSIIPLFPLETQKLKKRRLKNRIVLHALSHTHTVATTKGVIRVIRVIADHVCAAV